ncbi:MAG: nucleoside phosphorylase [Anaerolineales bacterium]|nr:nucleoside phosphorylase [Anaerolineales bacterium]
MNYPILEFDDDRQAALEPHKLLRPVEDIPQRAVICFFNDVLAALAETGRLEPIRHLGSEMGRIPVQRLRTENGDLTVMQGGVGAALGASFVEELIALGCRQFIACGGAGVLDSAIDMGSVLLPTEAIRDEGTSYHYLPAGALATPTPAAVAAIEAALARHGVPYITTKTWTTDAPYRETPGKIARRREQGCLAVEMEAAAFFAVAQFRGVEFGQMLYGGDDVSAENWDHRGWNTDSSVREKLFWLAVEAALHLPPEAR